MATLEDYRNERLRKLEEIKALGIDPYPAKSNRTEKIGDVIAKFDEFNEKEVTLVGRITAIRSFGKLVFIKIRDYFGEIQIFMKAEGELNFLTPATLSKQPEKSVNPKLAKSQSSLTKFASSQRPSAHFQVVTASPTKRNVIAAATLI